MLYYIHRYLSALHFVRLFVPQVGTLMLIVCQIHKHNMYHVVLKPTQTNEKQHYPIFYFLVALFTISWIHLVKQHSLIIRFIFIQTIVVS